MVKAVIFDMYETLITLFDSPIYFGTQIAADTGGSEEKFQALWAPAETDRTIGKISLEEILETAEKIGMRAVQAVWYLKDGTSQPATRKAGFDQIEKPMDILHIL